MGRQRVGGIALLVGTMLLAGLESRAQPLPRMSRIGWLGPGDAASAVQATADFRQGLRDLKYVEGQNFAASVRIR